MLMMCCSQRENEHGANAKRDRVARTARPPVESGAEQVRAEGRIIADPPRLPQSAERPDFQRDTGTVRLLPGLRGSAND
jgi:hypothetical protein